MSRWPLPAKPVPIPLPRRLPLVPEGSEFLQGEEPVTAKVEAFLGQAMAALADRDSAAHALVPWKCDVLQLKHSFKAFGRDLVDFVRHMEAQGVDPLQVTADHVKLYKRALLEAGLSRATLARRLSVLRGTYQQLAAKGLIAWETAQDIAAVTAPQVQKNSTPSLTQKQAIAFFEAIPTDTLQGLHDFALMSVFFMTGCRVSAIVAACVGHLETDGVEHYLNVTDKRHKKHRKILLDAVRAVKAYVERAGIAGDPDGPLFRPLTPDGLYLAAAISTTRRRGAWSRNTVWSPASIPRVSAAAASACIHFARPRSTTPSATVPRCMRCANSRGTATSARPNSTSSAKARMPRWPPAASRSG